MGKVLTEDTVLKCVATPEQPAPHGGTLSKSGVGRLKVDGHKVLTTANILVATATISACQNKEDAGQVKCTAVSEVTSGKATKLKVDGEFVVIDPPGGTTNGTPPGTIAAGAGVHDRLKAE